jgi:hypothetical protein
MYILLHPAPTLAVLVSDCRKGRLIVRNIGLQLELVTLADHHEPYNLDWCFGELLFGYFVSFVGTNFYLFHILLITI